MRNKPVEAPVGVGGTAHERCGLPFRDALADHAGTSSRLIAEGGSGVPPVVTIAIPTFRRPELLVDAVRSALQQRFKGPYEVVIVDNDPGSTDADHLLREVPELKSAKFRYYVNDDNIGMFGNWNRCISLARGEWIAILNDDDLLHEDFLELVFDAMRRNPGADGVTCRKRYLDLRASPPPGPSAPPRRRLYSALRGVAARTLRAMVYRWHFGRDTTRRLHPRIFFWGPVAGTPNGFAWRRELGIQIGGFYPEEYPAADLWFYARFAAVGHLRQHRTIAATNRILANESGNPETLKQSLRSLARLQEALLARCAPSWWRRFSGLVIAPLRGVTVRAFGMSLSDSELREMQVPVAAERPLTLALIRLLLGGWHPDPS